MAYERLVNPEYISQLLEKEAGACNPSGTRRLSEKFARAYQKLQRLTEREEIMALTPNDLAEFTMEPADLLTRAFTHPGKDYPDYEFISPVKWYQFWRVRDLFKRDYILSRAGEIIMQERMAAHFQKELDAEEEAQG